MKRNLIVFVAATALATLSGVAAARDHVSFNLSIGAPGYTYVAPPAYYYRPQVYYEPAYYRAHTYYAPAPVYYAPAHPIYVKRGHWHQGKKHRHGRY